MKEDKIDSRVVIKSLFIIASMCIGSFSLFIVFYFQDLKEIMLSEEFFQLFRNIHIVLLIAVAVGDLAVMHSIKKRMPLIDNKYFEWHRKYGFIKLTTIKILGVALIISAHLMRVPVFATSIGIILLGAYYSIDLLIDFIRNKEMRT